MGQRKVSTFTLGESDSLAAVIGISQGMADFLGPYGIRVNTVSPAVVASSIMGPDRIVSGVKRLVNGKWFIQSISFSPTSSQNLKLELSILGGYLNLTR